MMHFRMSFHIRFLPIQGENVRMTISRPHSTQVEFRPRQSDHSCECITTVEWIASPIVRGIFERIDSGDLDPHSDPDWQAAGLAAELELHGPSNYREAIEHVRSRCVQSLLHCVGVVCWRFGLDWRPLDFYADRRMQWSLNGDDWRAIPGTGGVAAASSFVIARLDGRYGEVIQDLINENGLEPLSHELWREAWGLTLHYKRAALMLGISAVEVGFKELVVSLEPGTEWLVNEAPNPPVVKMVREYLPALLRKPGVPANAPYPPEALIKVLTEAISKRNQVTHRGGTNRIRSEYGNTMREAGWDDRELRRRLKALRDFLWLFDYYRGTTWAIQHLTKETRDAIK